VNRQPNYALNWTGRPRRAALVLAKARTRPSAAYFCWCAECCRPARQLTLLR
jgi:hypothetical protein